MTYNIHCTCHGKNKTTNNMKKIFYIAFLLSLPIVSYAQNEEEDTENGVVSVAGKEGFKIASKNGDFVFKPYLMVQSTVNFNYYDDEGLDKAYNQDNVANSGFGLPYAIIGFTGKAFKMVTYNISVNAAGSGGNILQQAWFDVKFKPEVAVRVGKFKTPFTHGYLTTLGETLLPSLPTSLTATAIMPYSLNSVTPMIGTGFDLGIEVHGLLAKRFGYEVGIFNGAGSGINNATKTFSDDWHIPSLLYAGRFTWMPKGVMPSTQGTPKRLQEDKMLLGVSLSENVESGSESTNELRAGLEFSMLKNRWYVGAEAYLMHVGFTKRQKIHESFNYWGAYAQVGYFATNYLQLAARYDFMDRNSTGNDGLLNMPAVGANFFVPHTNLKVQAMYQYVGRTGHATQLDRDNDDLGIAKHSAKILLQYTF